MIITDDWIRELHYKEYIKPKLKPNDFYMENGVIVMTEEYHKKRGSCCGSGCKHCPYWPMYQKSNTKLKTN